MTNCLKASIMAFFRSGRRGHLDRAQPQQERQSVIAELQEVYRAKDPMEAGIVVAMLRQEGIKAELSGAMLQSAVGDIPAGWPTLPRIMVSPDDYSRARKIVVDWDAKHVARANDTSPPADQPTWTCPECSEEVDYNFEMCWNCQYNRTAC